MHPLKHLPSLLLLALLSCCLIASTARSETPISMMREDAVRRARVGIARLDELYWSPTLNIWLDRPGDDLRAHYEGRRNPPWWPAANAVEMLIDFMAATGTAEYEARIAALYDLQKDNRARGERLVAELKRRNQWSDNDEQTRQQRLEKAPVAHEAGGEYYSDFQNEYLDDSGWWGITWLKMFDRTRAPKYLATARTIHTHMAKNWNPEKGGGILWCEDVDKQRPNAITNSLFLILSARLYQRTHEEAYLAWAEKTLEWIGSKSLYDGTAVVDAPGHKGDYWSYNQGAFIGGLTALHEATGRQEYLEKAVKVTDSVLKRSGLVLPSGVIIEKLGAGGDACLFKGVFVRYLAQIRDVLRKQNLHPDTARDIERGIGSSIESFLRHSIGADELFSAEWHEGAKDRRTNFNTQVSALVALVAMNPDVSGSARGEKQLNKDSPSK